MTQPVDVRKIMTGIRQRLRGLPAGDPRTDAAASPSAILTSIDWTRLEDLAKILQARSRYVGRLPPQPATRRGRIGSWLVRLVRRGLFWYTSQIQEFQAVSAHAFEEEVECLKALARALAAEVAAREELAATFAAALHGPASGPAGESPDPRAVDGALPPAPGSQVTRV
jgi:hypothetical protein